MVRPPPLDLAAHALFLDFDGTLVGFADDPDAVVVAPAVLRRLVALERDLSGAFAIVSGRRIAALDGFLSPLSFAAAGVHGLERRMRSGDATVLLAGPESLDSVRAALAAALPGAPGLDIEDKGTALVLHYRTAPEQEGAAKAMMRAAVGERADLVIMEGESIVEVHPAGMDKGKAVADLMAEPAFAGRIPVYAGDDVTDEFALAYVRKASGLSIKIGDAPSTAEFRLDNVAALHRWLGVGA